MLIGMHIDPSGEISKQLIPFPQYSCPTNGVCMLHVASTSHGRIFCGGSDGHLYEVLYRADEGWGKRRCQLACHSSGLLSYYSRLLPSVLRFGSPQPVKQVAVDEERGILYTRSEGGSLACYDLARRRPPPAACFRSRVKRLHFARTPTPDPVAALTFPALPFRSCLAQGGPECKGAPKHVASISDLVRRPRPPSSPASPRSLVISTLLFPAP